jgi:hypothetical protein
MAWLHAMIAAQLDLDADLDAQAEQVLIGIETDCGAWVQALIAVGHQVYAVNPLQASGCGNATVSLARRACLPVAGFGSGEVQ